MNTTTINAMSRKYKLSFDVVRSVVEKLGAKPIAEGRIGKNTMVFYDASVVEPPVAEHAAAVFSTRASRRAAKLKKMQASSVGTAVSATFDDERLRAIEAKLDALIEAVKRIEANSVVSMEAFSA